MTPIDWNDSEPTLPDFLPPVEDNSKPLTGRRRFRNGKTVGCYGALILQVEYSKYMPAYDRHACFWRDAKAEDITPAETVVDL